MPERLDPDKNKEWAIPPAQGIQKDRHAKEEPLKLTPEASKFILFATLAIYCKKFLGLFTDRKRTALVDMQQMLQDLAAFKKLLLALGQEDQSHNPSFTLQLSELWHHLLDDYERIESLEKGELQITPKIKTIIDNINSFPPKEDHHLGYYLTEYVGAKWLPFPFMDMLQKLHLEHQASPEVSTLASWIASIDEAMSAISAKPQ